MVGNAATDPSRTVPVPYIEFEGNGTVLALPSDQKGLTMPGVDFQQLRAQITMQQVLDLVRFEPTNRRGDQWYGDCPLHDSTSPRRRKFSVNVAIGRYYCHQCHSKGNQLDLSAAFTKLPLYKAAIDLCRALDREVPWVHRW